MQYLAAFDVAFAYVMMHASTVVLAAASATALQ